MNGYYRHFQFQKHTTLIGVLFLIVSIFLFATPRDQLGDVNNDGDINVLDIVRIVNIILENDPPPTDLELWAGDVNADETVNVQDIVIIVTIIMQTYECPDLYSPCSDNLSNCCMDSTIHFNTWEIDTLGHYGSYLTDVAVISENNIWVVGQIVTDSTTYNAAKWDGTQWELFAIVSGYAPLYSIKFFANDDIWVTSYSFPLHWDGTTWTLYHLQNMGLNVSVGRDIWGLSSSDLYFVGYDGAIVHYDGSEFVEIESGTEVDLQNIDGTPDGDYIFILGYDDLHEPAGNTVLQLHENEVTELYYSDMYNQGPYGATNAVEVIGDTTYVKIQHGIWRFNYLTGASNFTLMDECCPGHGGVRSMVFNSLNDIFMANGVGVIFHYNGSTWQVDDWLHESRPTQIFDMAIHGDMITMVGHFWFYQTGLVVKGYR